MVSVVLKGSMCNNLCVFVLEAVSGLEANKVTRGVGDMADYVYV